MPLMLLLVDFYPEPRAYSRILRRVLGQMPPRKTAPNPKNNPNSNPYPNQGSIFLQGNCLVVLNPKTNPNLKQNPNPNQGAIFFGGQDNCPDTINKHYCEFPFMFKQGYVYFFSIFFFLYFSPTIKLLLQNVKKKCFKSIE